MPHYTAEHRKGVQGVRGFLCWNWAGPEPASRQDSRRGRQEATGSPWQRAETKLVPVCPPKAGRVA